MESTTTITITLDAGIATALLKGAGWTIEPCDGGNAYIRPGHPTRAEGGAFGLDYLWSLDEALGKQLVSQAVDWAMEHA